MTFIIEPFEQLEVEIPAGKSTVTLTFPPLDCFTPDQVEKMNAQLSAVEEGTPDHLDPNKNPIALAKGMLKFFNPSKAAQAAIDALVPRHVREIDTYWTDGSGISLGKSEPSTDTSGEKSDQE